MNAKQKRLRKELENSREIAELESEKRFIQNTTRDKKIKKN